MKQVRKVLAILLSVVMMVGVVSTAAFAFDFDKDKAPQYDMYLTFGDSISAGYFFISREEVEQGGTLQSFNGKTYGNRVEGTYPDILASEVGIERGSKNYYKFAREGMSALGMTRIVDPEFENTIDDIQLNGDNLLWDLYTEEGQATLTKLRKQYKKALKKSKGKKVLVTTMVGANDMITGPLMDAYFQLKDAIAAGDQHHSLVIKFDDNFKALLAAGNLLEAAELIQKVGNVVLAQPDILGNLINDELNCYFRYFDRVDAFMNAVHDDFTAAGVEQLDIVAVGLYNATKELQFDDILGVKTGKIMWWYTKLMNRYLSGIAVTRENIPFEKGYYKYAYAQDTETNEWPSMVTWITFGTSFLKWFMWCSHPTADGHKYIASQVLDTLKYGEAPVTYYHQGNTTIMT